MKDVKGFPEPMITRTDGQRAAIHTPTATAASPRSLSVEQKVCLKPFGEADYSSGGHISQTAWG